MPFRTRRQLVAGIAALDNERKMIAERAAAVLAAEIAGDVAEADGRLLRCAINQVLRHFREEEALMWDTNYGAVLEHMTDHAALLRFVASLRDEIDMGDPDPDLVFVACHLLATRLLRHAETFDRGFRHHLENRAAHRETQSIGSKQNPITASSVVAA